MDSGDDKRRNNASKGYHNKITWKKITWLVDLNTHLSVCARTHAYIYAAGEWNPGYGEMVCWKLYESKRG